MHYWFFCLLKDNVHFDPGFSVEGGGRGEGGITDPLCGAPIHDFVYISMAVQVFSNCIGLPVSHFLVLLILWNKMVEHIVMTRHTLVTIFSETDLKGSFLIWVFSWKTLTLDLRTSKHPRHQNWNSDGIQIFQEWFTGARPSYLVLRFLIELIRQRGETMCIHSRVNNFSSKTN